MKVRLHYLCSLIFFAFFFLCSCGEKNGEITVVWDNNQAVAISIPKNLLQDVDVVSLNELLQVRVDKGSSAMLGEYQVLDHDIIFKPVVSLTRGLSYQVLIRDKLVGHITIPVASEVDSPVLVNVYPTSDTLPENLLKMYLQFSRPMREGESLKHIFLLDKNKDTLPRVFLDLQPELWNDERTVLTIWLDPGRIKRELIPNQKLGNPLKRGGHYTLAIDDNWMDVQGLALQQPYNNRFVVDSRDSIPPDLEKWTLNVPAATTNKPLYISLDEPLDYFLLQETITIANERGDVVAGKLNISNEESSLQFMPEKQWIAGRYKLRVESILEDLAGNNLNKPFDRDIRVKKLQTDKPVYVKGFEIKQ